MIFRRGDFLSLNKIVVHNKDGKILKGTTADFRPNKPVFHLIPGGIRGAEVREIVVDNLKGVFYVKSFGGNKDYNDIKGFIGRPREGKRVKVIFEDGEVIFGYTHAVNCEQFGFFVLPADRQSNNERVFAVFSSINKLEVGGQFLLRRVILGKNQDLWDKFL